MTLFVYNHADWQKEIIEQHNAQKPFAPENGNKLLFKVGDDVIYTNENGVSFNLKIAGLYQPNPIDSLYAVGRRYLLNWPCFWFPIKECDLEFDLKHELNKEEE